MPILKANQASDAELAAHEADTTSVHGVADTALLATQAEAEHLQEILLAAQGYKGMSGEINYAAFSSAAFSNQQVGGMAVPFKAGTLITNLHIFTVAVGVTVTASWLGLYSKAGARLAQTADLGTNWTDSAGLKTHALTSPYTILTDDLYYLVGLALCGTSPNVANTGQNGSVAWPALGANSLPYVRQTGQTSLPANATFVSWSVTPWIAAS